LQDIVLKAVLATDISDPTLKVMRDTSWKKAFAAANDSDTSNRKATLLIEHMMQASDVVHTMQNFVNFRKWNERLYEEKYVEYLTGRAGQHPLDYWYNGELSFFDYYIIPLANRLREFHAFGDDADGYVHNATQNRAEWSAHGNSFLAPLHESLFTKHANLS
jgi:hypothetical protein